MRNITRYLFGYVTLAIFIGINAQALAITVPTDKLHGEAFSIFEIEGQWSAVAVSKKNAKRRSSLKLHRIRGTNRADRLRGTKRADKITGRRGRDRIWGRAGNDRLYGGRGKDIIRGGRGSDRLYGGKGADRLYGDRGNDRLSGGDGADVLRGGAGRDRIYGGKGKDRIYGGKGSDRITASGGGRDVIDCGSGRDTVYVDIRDSVRNCEKVVRKQRPKSRDGGGTSEQLPAGTPGFQGGLLPQLPVNRPPEVEKPNIVLILTDDQRYGTVTEEAVPGTGTPYMPRVSSLLADRGLSFSRAMVTTSLCCPSRASILTGKYAHNHGVLNNGSNADPPDGGFPAFHEGDEDSTIATWLSDAGYRTGLIGKYLNQYGSASYDTDGDGELELEDQIYVPPGWDNFRAFLWEPRYFDYRLNIDGNEIADDFPEPDGDNPGYAANYSTDVLKEHALEFIQASADDDKPFFLYFSPYAPHLPATPALRHEDAFTDIQPYNSDIVGSFNEEDVSDKPAWIQDNLSLLDTDELDWVAELRLRQLQSTLAVDDAVGEIVKQLEILGELDNTVIVYTSDNGIMWGEHRIGRAGRLKKANAYEEAIRVPLIFSGPGVRTGTTDLIGSNIDLAPTIAELAGVTPPADVDGRSLLPLFSGQPTSWRNDLLIEHLKEGWSYIPTYQALYTDSPEVGRYKFVEYYDKDENLDERELYDLDDDPYEERSLLKQEQPPDDPDVQPLIESFSARVSELAACSGESCR